MSVPEIILRILDIIHYPDDKKKFVDIFSLFALEKTVIALLKTLPQEKGKDVYTRLQKMKEEELIEALKKEFSEKEYIKALNESIKVLLLDYVKTIRSTLNKDETKQLDAFLETLAK